MKKVVAVFTGCGKYFLTHAGYVIGIYKFTCLTPVGQVA